MQLRLELLLPSSAFQHLFWFEAVHVLVPPPLDELLLDPPPELEPLPDELELLLDPELELLLDVLDPPLLDPPELLPVLEPPVLDPPELPPLLDPPELVLPPLSELLPRWPPLPLAAALLPSGRRVLTSVPPSSPSNGPGSGVSGEPPFAQPTPYIARGSATSVKPWRA
jgi:hypothetical protein